MNLDSEVCKTLNCMHEAERVLLVRRKHQARRAASIGGGQMHDAMSPDVEVSKTLNCMSEKPLVMLAVPFENHAQDARASEIRGGCPTLGSSNGDHIQGKNVIILHKAEQ